MINRLQRQLELDNYQYDPDYIIKFFCAKSLGLTRECLLTSGLKDCIKCWNSEWEGDYEIEK